MFGVNQLGLVWDDFEDVIIADREQYRKIYEVIEEYAAEHDMIYDGEIGVALLNNETDRKHDHYFYRLVCDDAVRHANNIANAIDKVIVDCSALPDSEPLIVSLITNIPYAILDINVSVRRLVRVIGVNSKPVKLIDMINPPSVKFFDGNNVKVMSPEARLLDVYQTLYSPNQAGEWVPALIFEKKLFNALSERKATLTGTHKQGGGLDRSVRDKIIKEIYEKYITQSDAILVGEAAAYLITNGATKMTTPVINIIAGDKAAKKITAIIEAHGHKVTVVTRPVHVMQDRRLLRTTISIGDQNRKEIVYIYNSTDYELIPYRLFDHLDESNPTRYQIKVGNPFVVIRFLLIDLWLVKYVRNLGKINEHFAKQRIYGIISTIETIRFKMSDDSLTIDDSIINNIDSKLCVFQDSFIGRFIDETLMLKMQKHKKKQYIPTYYPVQHRPNYRTIQ